MPEELPVPDILPVPQAARTSAHARGIVHFNIRILLCKNREARKPFMPKWHACECVESFNYRKFRRVPARQERCSAHDKLRPRSGWNEPGNWIRRTAPFIKGLRRGGSEEGCAAGDSGARTTLPPRTSALQLLTFSFSRLRCRRRRPQPRHPKYRGCCHRLSHYRPRRR